MAISFGGSTIGRPGAFSIVDTSGMIPLFVGASKTLAFIGEAGALKAGVSPTDVLYFNTPKEATDVLGAGELVEHMKIAWKHGADLIAVSIVVGSGAQSALVDADWDKAINRLETEDIDGIVLVSTATAVQVKIDTHCTVMSGVLQRKERRGFYGHATGLTKTTVLTAKTSLTTDRAVFASPGVYVVESSGRVLKPSTYLASAYAGVWAKNDPQEPITYNYVQFDGLEIKFTQPEIAELVAGGVAVTEFVRGKGLRIVQGVTAHTSSGDLTKVELSVSYLKDLMSKQLRELLEEKFVGQAGVAGIETTILNYVGTVLDLFVQNGWIISYDPEKVHLIRTGTVYDIEWEGKPTLPINNFLITSRFVL